MRLSARMSRALGFIASGPRVAGVADWAATRTAAPSEAVTVLAGIAGVIAFAASLAPALARGRHRTMATGLVLVAVAVVVAATKQAPGTRTGFHRCSGAVVLRGRDRRPGRKPSAPGRAPARRVPPLGPGMVPRRGPRCRGSVLRVRLCPGRLLAGGGPAGLAAGTAAAILVAALAAMTLRARSRRGT